MEAKRTIGQALVQLGRTFQDYNYTLETKRKYGIAISNLRMFLKTCNESDSVGNLLGTYQSAISTRQYSSQYRRLQQRIVFLIQGFLVTGDFERTGNNRKYRICISNQAFLLEFDESVAFLDFGTRATSARVY